MSRGFTNRSHALPSRSRTLLGLAVGALALAGLAGCSSPALTRVHPWERGTLAQDSMNPDRDPLATEQAEHIFFSREAAAGGRGVGGAGCGCN